MREQRSVLKWSGHVVRVFEGKIVKRVSQCELPVIDCLEDQSVNGLIVWGSRGLIWMKKMNE